MAGRGEAPEPEQPIQSGDFIAPADIPEGRPYFHLELPGVIASFSVEGPDTARQHFLALDEEASGNTLPLGIQTGVWPRGGTRMEKVEIDGRVVSLIFVNLFRATGCGKR